MVVGKPDKKGLVILELRLFIFAMFCAYISGLTAYWYSLIWIIGNIAAATTVIFLAFIFFPVYLRNYSFNITGNMIIIKNGIFIKKTRYMYKTAVKYVSFSQSPLSRILKVKTVFIVAAGGSVYIPYLSEQEAEQLKLEVLPI